MPETVQAAEFVPFESLVPWDRNPRNNEDAIPKVMRSLEAFGFGRPLIAWGSTGPRRLVVGHTTFAAYSKLVAKHGEDWCPGGTPAPGMVPVRWRDDWTEEEAAGYAIADNRLGEIATWDDEVLAELLGELELGDVDLDAVGYSEADLDGLVERPEPPEAPEPEAPPEEPVSRVGEVYELGPHRLVCGDCRDPEVVARLLDEQEINVAFTSPPYASQRTYDEESGFKPIPPDEYVEWFEAVQRNVWAHLAGDGSWFVNITEAAADGFRLDYVKRLVLRHIDAWGWGWVEEYCWPRPALPMDPALSRRFKNGWESVYHFATQRRYKFRPKAVRHESACFFSYAEQKRAGKAVTASSQGDGGGVMSPVGQGAGLAYPSNVLENFGGANVVGHSAAFPVGLPTFFIKAFSDPGDLIFDPFLGSGTTLIAAARQGRVAAGCEISPRYCDVIRRRWTQWATEAGVDPGPGALS